MVIGTFLSVDINTLEDIKSSSNNNGEMLARMISEWLKSCKPPPTQQALAEAIEQLDSSKADEIRQMFS